MTEVDISPEKCDNCGRCVDICPEGIFKKQNSSTVIINKEYCMSCGHCISICPNGAITHENFSEDKIHSFNPKLKTSEEQVLELIRTRRSTRAFKDKKIDEETIKKLIDAANFAPSAKNKQTTRYTVIQDEKTLKSISEITFNFIKEAIKLFNNEEFISSVHPDEANVFSEIKPSYEHIIGEYENGNDLILHNAATLLFFHSKKGALSAEVNANLALQNASLMGTALGLGSFYAGYITGASNRTEYIARLIDIPNDHQIYAVLAVGYPKYQLKNWMDKKTPKIKWI